MNNSIEKLERMLGNASPTVPAELQSAVAKTVQKQLKQQTRLDDLKWIGMSFSILLLAFAVQWMVLTSVSNQCKETATMIAATEAGKQLAAENSTARSASNAFTNQLSNPINQSTNQ